MRIASAGVIALALMAAACSGPAQSAADASAEPAKSVMESEAEKACADMTYYSPEKVHGKSAEIQALMRREYDLCVKSVAADEPASTDAPASRRRTAAP